MAHPQLDPHHQGFTYGDYIDWPDEERWELIDGASYGKPDVLTLEGETPVAAIDGLTIRWHEAGL